VFAAFLDDQRDERTLPLEIFPGRHHTAGRNDLPRRVPQRVQEERALLADDIANLIACKLALPDHVKKWMVQPGVRVLSLLQQVSREFGRRKHGSSPCGHYWSRDDTRCMMASLRAVMGRISKSNVTYTITVSNTGRPRKGLTAEYVTVTL